MNFFKSILGKLNRRQYELDIKMIELEKLILTFNPDELRQTFNQDQSRTELDKLRHQLNISKLDLKKDGNLSNLDLKKFE
jgi:hypothetical protein